ncbi:MAG: hypothetical protein A2Z34_04155 [Planctomycetes bacterium RBG_16_59_8]|nr:MAG: hypothetical protein A2Z34_04155 [Planctomycetes bacterium RBG_16_59_8]
MARKSPALKFRFAVAVAALLVGGGSAFPAGHEAKFQSLKVVADFEEGIDDWDGTMSNVKKKPLIEAVDDAKVGARAAKITFYASPEDRKNIDWTLLYCPIDQWPADGELVSFWIKSTAEKTLLHVKLSEMRGNHNNYEGFQKEIEVSASWQQLRIPLSEFVYLWGHAKDKMLQKENISNISFSQADVTKELTIVVDQIEILKESKE